jgi:vancomycin resistance protein YoaR
VQHRHVTDDGIADGSTGPAGAPENDTVALPATAATPDDSGAPAEPAEKPADGPRFAVSAVTVGALAAAGILLLLVVLAGVLAVVHRGEALPGTLAGGVDVGGLGENDIRAALEPAVAERETTPVTVTAPDSELTVDPQETGYSVDVEASIVRALEAGRDGDPVSVGWAHLSSLWSQREVGLVDSVDPEAVRVRVDALAASVDREPVPGGFTVEPETLEVTGLPPLDGLTIRREEAVDAVGDALAGRRDVSVPLPVDVADPGTTQSDVDAVVEAARSALAGPVVLTGEGQTLEIPPGAYAGLLGSQFDGDDSLEFVIDTEALRDVVAEAAGELEQPARSARVVAEGPRPTFDDQGSTTWSPVPATVNVVEPSAEGRAVDVDAATVATEDAIRSGSLEGPLEIEIVPPAATTEQAAAINSVIGTFTTYHAAGQPRVRNIHRIADQLDGIVIGPGQQFSINDITGPRTLSQGYVNAPVIQDGELEDGVAGGISQFATTMFNAAFFAGIPLDAFQPHSFYISRYPVGREATLAFGSLDVAWTNDTNAAILVDTSYTNSSITVTLYGDNGGRTVEAITGSRRSRANGGFTIDVTRVVSGPVSSRRTITTSYNPEPDD